MLAHTTHHAMLKTAWEAGRARLEIQKRGVTEQGSTASGGRSRARVDPLPQLHLWSKGLPGW